MITANIKRILYDSVHQYNILPLTSGCNVNCMFCSHKQNSHEVEALAMPPLSCEEIEELMLFLSPDRKIVIGESATRIMEGEPFTHPEFLNILTKLRERFPLTPLQITTNGSFLTPTIIEELKELEPLELNISLNSGTISLRSKLMQDSSARIAIEGVAALQNAGIIYHGSLVAVPWLTGWEDIRNTIHLLAQSGSQTIRVFIPGFTRFNQDIQLPSDDWEKELRSFLLLCRREIRTPLTIEPPALQDLRAIITGVIEGSKSQSAGIRPGMEILSINGRVPFSRVEVFETLNSPGIYKIELKNSGCEETISMCIDTGEKSGLVMDYDLSSRTIKSILKVIKKKRAQHPLILASEWGAPLLKVAFKNMGYLLTQDNVVAVKNEFFGGTIRSAGLLMVDDFRTAIRNYISENEKPDILFLPAIAFDRQGRDLCGVPYTALSDAFSIAVELV